MTAQPDVTTRDGWLFDGHLPTGWEAFGDKCGVDGVPPCLVVTGNLDAARARLEAATPDDVRERAVGIVVGLSYLDPCDGGRIIDALADAGLLRGPETSSAAPEGAALSASGTVRRAGGPDHGTAPVGDDVKARAREAAYDAGLRPYSSYVHAVVDAVAAAGLLAAPSHLDRLAAWAEGASGRELAITTEDPQPEIKWLIEACPAGVKPLDGDVVEFDSDIQEAARRVLARLPENAPSGTWTDAQVDGLARHLYLVENGGPKPWAELAEETQDVWRSRARRALAAVEEASS